MIMLDIGRLKALSNTVGGMWSKELCGVDTDIPFLCVWVIRKKSLSPETDLCVIDLRMIKVVSLIRDVPKWDDMLFGCAVHREACSWRGRFFSHIPLLRIVLTNLNPSLEGEYLAYVGKLLLVCVIRWEVGAAWYALESHKGVPTYYLHSQRDPDLSWVEGIMVDSNQRVECMVGNYPYHLLGTDQ